MLYQIFLSQQVKRGVIISNAHDKRVSSRVAVRPKAQKIRNDQNNKDDHKEKGAMHIGFLDLCMATVPKFVTLINAAKLGNFGYKTELTQLILWYLATNLKSHVKPDF